MYNIKNNSYIQDYIPRIVIQLYYKSQTIAYNTRRNNSLLRARSNRSDTALCAQSYREQSGHIPNMKHQEALGLLSQTKSTLESSRKYARINHKDTRKPYLGRVKARGHGLVPVAVVYF